MRTFLALLIAGGLGVLFYYQKHQDVPSITASATTVQTVPHSAMETSPRPAVSEHNWMKRSLDRATEVRDQARSQTRQSQDP
jgi:type IV secretory pathway VirB6-like protein